MVEALGEVAELAPLHRLLQIFAREMYTGYLSFHAGADAKAPLRSLRGRDAPAEGRGEVRAKAPAPRAMPRRGASLRAPEKSKIVL